MQLRSGGAKDWRTPVSGLRPWARISLPSTRLQPLEKALCMTAIAALADSHAGQLNTLVSTGRLYVTKSTGTRIVQLVGST